MASTDARPIPKKNTAHRWSFKARDLSGNPVPDITSITVSVSKDGGAFAAATNNSITQIGPSSGHYFHELIAAEMNTDTTIVKVSSLEAITEDRIFYPEDTGDIRVDVSTQVDTALSDIRLDELISATAGAVKPIIGSFEDQKLNKDSGQTFNQFTDSMEGLRDDTITLADLTAHDDNLTIVDIVVDAIKAKTDTLPATPADEQTVNAVIAAIGGLQNISAAEVKTQILNAISVDQMPELLQATPPDTPTMWEAFMYFYMGAINEVISTQSQTSIRNAVGNVVAKAATSDNGSIYTKAKHIAGP